jgi:ankyrin repeat protein
MASKADISKFVQNRGDVDLMKQMLDDESIPHVNVVDTTYNNYTALIYQTFSGTIEAMEFLLTCYPPADPNAISSNKTFTMLQHAVHENDPDKIRLLLEHGADRNLKGYINSTPLDYAKKHHPKHKECIEVLESYFPETR